VPTKWGDSHRTSMRSVEILEGARAYQESAKPFDPAAIAYREVRSAHWDRAAVWAENHRGLGGTYHRRLAKVFGFLCPPGLRVLEIGSGNGDLLASLHPSHGVGVDFSPKMIAQARKRHPDLTFLEADAHELKLGKEFDVIILSDLIDDLWDVQEVLRQARNLCAPHTRLILNFYSRLWETPLSLARRLKLAKPNLAQNWLTVEDVTGMLALADFEVIRHREEVLCPFRIPLIAPLANRCLVHVWPFRLFALTHVLVVRPVLTRQETKAVAPRVSVIVAARNEAGNIESIFTRMPEIGAETELIFVEGGSSDDTHKVIETAIDKHPETNAMLLKQIGEGKGDAVRLGFSKASGDILAILDADLTTPPEDLTRFVEVLTSGKGDFANGCRLVYPMEKDAMRFFNLVGNKFFSLMFSWLLDQPIKDTLCGTKVIWKSDYELLAANRQYFGEFDPFGDFDLLFGASKLNLKIVDIPVRYRNRTYGATNIRRWKHSWLLLRMMIFAARRLKFV
jgi:SAM-dependent methyltransferase